MTPDEHDQLSAHSQNLTHVLGRILQEISLKPCDIATQGYTKLISVMEQTCHDRWELFYDMLQFNPYSQNMLKELQLAIDSVFNKLDMHNQGASHGQQ